MAINIQDSTDTILLDSHSLVDVVVVFTVISTNTKYICSRLYLMAHYYYFFTFLSVFVWLCHFVFGYLFIYFVLLLLVFFDSIEFGVFSINFIFMCLPIYTLHIDFRKQMLNTFIKLFFDCNLNVGAVDNSYTQTHINTPYLDSIFQNRIKFYDRLQYFLLLFNGR